MDRKKEGKKKWIEGKEEVNQKGTEGGKEKGRKNQREKKNVLLVFCVCVFF